MKRKIYLLAISVITIACVTVGILHNTFGFGKNSWFFRWSDSLKNKISDTEEIEAGKEIEIIIDLSLADISIETGKKYEMNYTCNEELRPILEVRNGQITITQKKKKIWSMGNRECNIVLTIPDDVHVSVIKADMDLGDLDISNVKCDSSDVTCNLGDIDIKNSQLGTVDFTCNLGDCDIERCTFTSLNVDMDLGDIEVNCSQDLSDFDIDISCDMGEVEVNDEDYGKKYRRDGDKNSFIYIKNNMGDISLHY